MNAQLLCQSWGGGGGKDSQSTFHGACELSIVKHQSWGGGGFTFHSVHELSIMNHPSWGWGGGGFDQFAPFLVMLLIV